MQDGKGMKAHLKQVVRTCSGKLMFLLMGRCVGVGTLLLGMNVDVMNTISGWEWTIIRVIVGWALRVWGRKLVGVIVVVETIGDGGISTRVCGGLGS